ncbi:hypothetical protein J3R82DRAFT_8851 [Butyriboletus roseoflavus]|nr:hypothetical protein J3R82DRAFT_8851 [Butyriboletus roseoflavus]
MYYSHRENIYNFHPDYLVTTDSWPYFMYKNDNYNAKDPINGLFKNTLLLKAFKCIFTSPGSADSEVQIDNLDNDVGEHLQVARKHQKNSNEQRTHSHIAALLGINCNSWHIVDEDFDYQQFYHNIVTFFEDVETEKEKWQIDDLLF